MGKLLTRCILGLAVGLFFVWLTAREWPLGQLFAGAVRVVDGHLVVGSVELHRLASGRGTEAGWAMSLWWLAPFLGILTLVHFLRVLRWKPLVDPIVRLDLRTHNRIGAVGFMALFLMPFRLGEFVRPYLVKRASGDVRMTRVLPTAAVERITDGLVVSLLLFVVLQTLPANDPTVRAALQFGAFFALSVFVGATGLLVGACWQHDRTLRLIHATVGRISTRLAHGITELLDTFVGGLRTLPSMGAFASFVGLTLGYWAINGMGVWMMAQAFYLPVGLLGAYAMMACVVVGMMIPNSPGNMGSFWYFLLLPLPLYGISSESTQAIAFGITVWTLQLLQQSAFGAWFLLRGRVSFHRVVEAAREDPSGLQAA